MEIRAMASIVTFRTCRAAALVTALLLAVAPLARAELETIEQAFETDSATVSLPDGVERSVSLPGCGKTCPSSVRYTAETTFFLRERQVALADLRAYFARGRVQYTLFYDPKTLVVNRVIAY
jgi:hypothetical protein